MSAHIVVVEDDLDIQQLLCFALRQDGHTVSVAASALEATDLLPQADLLVFDWMLPGRSGIEMLQHARRHPALRDTPVLMLTAKSSEDDKVLALDAGADDFMVKPFSPRELCSRVRAILRRSNLSPSTERCCGVLRANIDTQQVWVDNAPLSVGLREFALLWALLEKPERVLSRQQLITKVWGEWADVEERTVDVHILRLRKALKTLSADHCVCTARGVGYFVVA